MAKERTAKEKHGIVTFMTSKCFDALTYLPPYPYIKGRVQHQEEIENLSEEQRKTKIDERVQRIDIVIIGCFVLYFLFIVFQQIVNNYFWSQLIVSVTLLLRLINIFQSNVNIVLFDSLKLGVMPNKVASNVRSITLASVNFMEVGIIFGLFYTMIPGGLSSGGNQGLTVYDNFYFSFVTQLTIGYGDITPKGFTKALCVFQGLIGYFFTILIITRLLSSMPSIEREDARN